MDAQIIYRKNCLREKEFIKGITSMIEDVPHAGMSRKMMITYFSV